MLFQKKIKAKHILLVIISIYLTFFIFLNLVKYLSPDNYAELIRVRLRDGDAVSTIRTVFKSNFLTLFTLDYILVIIRMLFPIELIRFGAKYLIYVAYQFMLSFFAIKSLINIRKLDYKQKNAVMVYWSFTLASATFEPDFGSWIRHEAVLFPLFLIMCNMLNTKKFN